MVEPPRNTSPSLEAKFGGCVQNAVILGLHKLLNELMDKGVLSAIREASKKRLMDVLKMENLYDIF